MTKTNTADVTYADLPDVDALAQEIRRVNAGNNLGAGALAEALMPFICASYRQTPEPVTVALPKMWAPEEVEDGERGIRWVTNEGIHGRPTDHDVREYLKRTPTANGCLCDECKVFYAAVHRPPVTIQDGK